MFSEKEIRNFVQEVFLKKSSRDIFEDLFFWGRKRDGGAL